MTATRNMPSATDHTIVTLPWAPRRRRRREPQGETAPERGEHDDEDEHTPSVTRITTAQPSTGERAMSIVGLGWRPETAAHFGNGTSVPDFTEVVAEQLMGQAVLPDSLAWVRDRGTPIIPHGIGLGLGDPAGLDVRRVDALARVAERVGAPLVSEHIAFVRAGEIEIGHLMPVPRCEAMLETLIERVSQACQILPVPLALENIAALIDWPEDEMDEATFIGTLLAETPARLLLDVSNLYANAKNHGREPEVDLAQMPLAEVAYVHVAGGVVRDGLYRDTHAHPLSDAVVELVAPLAHAFEARVGRPLPVLLERDDRFPSFDELAHELRTLEIACSVTGAALATSSDRACSKEAAREKRDHISAAAVEPRQHELAHALRHGAPAPSGFEQERVNLVASDMLRKQRAEHEARVRRERESLAWSASLSSLGDLLGVSWRARARKRLTAWFETRG